MLEKMQIIDAIRQINRSATLEWLGTFDDESLRRYLEHLQLTEEPRGRNSRWIRRDDSPAIMTRHPIT